MRWVIGDIHGMLRPLQAVLAAVRARDADASFIFLGDYINRGPDAKGVVDLLLALDPAKAKFLRGNHDDVFDLILRGTCYAHDAKATPVDAFKWFHGHGLDKTLASYGIQPSEVQRVLKKQTPAALAYAMEPVPAAHRAFFRDLLPAVVWDDCFVLHALWPIDSPTTAILEQLKRHPEQRHRALWGRYADADLVAPKPWDRPGYFGHTAVVNYNAAMRAGKVLPVAGERLTMLDTAAALGPYGRLTAFCIETQRFVQADPQGQIVPEEAILRAAER